MGRRAYRRVGVLRVLQEGAGGNVSKKHRQATSRGPIKRQCLSKNVAFKFSNSEYHNTDPKQYP